MVDADMTKTNVNDYEILPYMRELNFLTGYM
jgi:hypothetical protein